MKDIVSELVENVAMRAQDDATIRPDHLEDGTDETLVAPQHPERKEVPLFSRKKAMKLVSTHPLHLRALPMLHRNDKDIVRTAVRLSLIHI